MTAEYAFDHDIDVEMRTRHPDRGIATLAGAQHGVVSRRQLFVLGLGRGAIFHRLERGRLHEVHSGVYAVGHRLLSDQGRWMAAVLAGPSGTVLSHRSAAALWEIRPHRGRAEVTFRRQMHGSPGVLLHKASLPEDEITRVDGIPVTTVSRTILDLAAVLDCSRVERALNEAEVCGLGGALTLADLVRRYPGRRGIVCIRRLAQAGAGVALTRSELEERFLALISDYGLPQPLVNAGLFAGGRWYEADCVWRDPRLVVELDGRAFHATTSAFERDRARDRALQVAGWRVVRVTWRQLASEPEAVVADLRRLLAQGPSA
jgi:hypothetical protein